MDIVLYALTAFLYVTLCAADGCALWQRAQVAMGGLPASVKPPAVTRRRVLRASGMAVWQRATLLLALLVHCALLHLTIFTQHEMMFGFAFALSAMFWLGTAIYWVESFFFALDGLRLMLLPLSAVASLLPLVFGGVCVLPYAATPLFKLHFVIANAAYGVFAIAALHAVLMLAVERRLHALSPSTGARGAHRATSRMWARNWLSGWLETLPPLLTLEKCLFRLLAAGFVLLTLTLASGMLFNTQLDGHLLDFDHKTVFSILAWLMFGALLTARRLSGWRGRAALRWVIAAFVALLLAYVGSRFVFEVLLHRPVV